MRFKPRRSKAKFNRGKIPAIIPNYGSELPSFAYDFSEFFINSVIERSGETNLMWRHVTIL
jgi:hypothetical protein